LGIAAPEDKIVQQAVATVLSAIYETDSAFLTAFDRSVASMMRWMRFVS